MAERREIAVVRRAGVAEDLREVEGEMGQERGVTLRAVVFGICVAVGVSLLANTVVYVLHGSYMTISMMPMVNLMLFLLSVLACAGTAVRAPVRLLSGRVDHDFLHGVQQRDLPYLQDLRLPPQHSGVPVLFRDAGESVGGVHPSLPARVVDSLKREARTNYKPLILRCLASRARLRALTLITM